MTEELIQLRLAALQLAVGESSVGEQPETTVARAETYYNFLKGTNNGS